VRRRRRTVAPAGTAPATNGPTCRTRHRGRPTSRPLRGVTLLRGKTFGYLTVPGLLVFLALTCLSVLVTLFVALTVRMRGLPGRTAGRDCVPPRLTRRRPAVRVPTGRLRPQPKNSHIPSNYESRDQGKATRTLDRVGRRLRDLALVDAADGSSPTRSRRQERPRTGPRVPICCRPRSRWSLVAPQTAARPVQNRQRLRSTPHTREGHRA